MTAMIDRMAYVGENPWWIGTEEDRNQAENLGGEAVTAEEILKAAGQDWQVNKVPIYANGANVRVIIPGHNAIVREDTGDVLGLVTSRYEPVQNREAFKFFDSVVGEGQAIYHTAGSLGKGERVWILAKLPEDTIIKGVDIVQNFLLLANGHDGNFAFRMMYTPIRVVCQNTLNIATGYGRASAPYRLSHFTGIQNKLNVKDAQEALGLANSLIEIFAEQAEELAQTEISEDEVDALLQRLFPLPSEVFELSSPRELLLLPEPKQENLAPDLSNIWQKREVVRTLISRGKGNDNPAVERTRWAAFNGVAEFTDYVQTSWEGKRSEKLLFGGGRWLKQEAWNLLTRKEK